MTRFVMTLSEAVELVLNSMRLSQGGEVFVTPMPALNMRDMAEVMVDLLAPMNSCALSDIAIQEVGPRPGVLQEEVRQRLVEERS